MESAKNKDELGNRSSDEPEVRKSGPTRTLMSTHTPIIITDGSASVDFDKTHYPENVGTGEFIGDKLGISHVEIRDKNEPDQTKKGHICVLTPDKEKYRVTIVCVGKDFVVTDMGGSVKVKFDRVEYKEDTLNPPPPSRRKFKSAGQKIKGIMVHNSAGTLIHRCKLVPGNGSCEVIVHDYHIVP